MLAGRKGVTYDFFTKSKKGVQLSFEDLFNKLLNAITCAITPDADADYYYLVPNPPEPRDPIEYSNTKTSFSIVTSSERTSASLAKNKMAAFYSRRGVQKL